MCKWFAKIQKKKDILFVEEVRIFHLVLIKSKFEDYSNTKCYKNNKSQAEAEEAKSPLCLRRGSGEGSRPLNSTNT